MQYLLTDLLTVIYTNKVFSHGLTKWPYSGDTDYEDYEYTNFITSVEEPSLYGTYFKSAVSFL